MKQELTIQGRVHMSPLETAEAMTEYVIAKEETDKAIKAWLLKKHQLQASRIRRSVVSNGIEAVIDIKAQLANGEVPKFSDDPKSTRETKGGFKRKNIGIFDYIRSYLADEKKANKKSVTFDDALKTVQFKFGKDNVDAERLAMYLHDKRMLQGYVQSFSKREGVIRL